MSLEKRAILLASGTAFSLAVTKTIVGILTGSLSVLASAADSLLDFFVSLVNLFAIKKAEAPADGEFRYGYGKIEGVGALFEGLVVAGSGVLIGYLAIGRLISGKGPEDLGASLYVMAFSMVVTGALVWFLKRTAKKTKNLIISSDALHYETDLYSNGAVLVGVIAMKFSGFLIIDAVVSLAISFYIIYGAFKIAKEAFEMLMDRRLPDDEEWEIVAVIESEIAAGNAQGYHFFKTRRSGKTRHIEFHLVFDTGILLFDAHEVAEKIEYEINRRLEHCEIMIHLDPYDDSAVNEKRAVPIRAERK